MNRQHKIIVSIVGIFVVLLALIGITYGYFLTRIEGNTNDTSISITTANMRLVYLDGTNEIVTKENIVPNTIVGTKDFSVKNEGNAVIEEYQVYIENVINEFKYYEDVKLYITCTSSIDGELCNGYENVFPKRNSMVISNKIEVGEVHTYKLVVKYIETGKDQSEDMGKKLEGKIQIYDPRNIITLTGEVTNYSDGYYVEMHSDVKTSQIETVVENGETKYIYTFTGVPASKDGHTLYIKQKDSDYVASKGISIAKGEEASISDDMTEIIFNDNTRKVEIDLTASDTVIDISNGKIIGVNPYEEDTLAYKIISNAIVANNEEVSTKTKYTSSSDSLPGRHSTMIYVDEDRSISSEEETINLLNDSDGNLYENPYYVSYGTNYKIINMNTGTYSLISEDDGESDIVVSKLASELDLSDLVGKFVFWDTNIDITNNTTSINHDLLVKVLSVDNGIITYSKLISGYQSTESSLREAIDDYTPISGINSYYYRGSVIDNYVDFDGMCWRIVRIQGDGSIKLILEDKDNTCKTSDGNWDVYHTTGSKIHDTGNFGYNLLTNSNNESVYIGNFLEPKSSSQNFIGALKQFQNNLSTESIDKLKVDNWCFTVNAYAGQTTNYFTTVPYSENDKYDSFINSNNFYYDSYIKLTINKMSSLACTGKYINSFIDGTNMYVGGITADEVAHAGAVASLDDKNYLFYLLNDYQKKTKISVSTDTSYGMSFWTITNSYYSSNNERAYALSGKGSLRDVTGVGRNDISYRPVVVLKSGTKLISGNGTKDEPFVI